MLDLVGGRLVFRGVIDVCIVQFGRFVREFIFDLLGFDLEIEFF